MGAAIADDASCLYKTGKVSLKMAINIYSEKDKILGELMRRTDGIQPAGYSSIKGVNAHNAQKYNIRETDAGKVTEDHKAVYYLRVLKNII